MQIAETSAARIYGLLIGLLSLFITARILGPEGQGILAATIAWVRMFASFGGSEPGPSRTAPLPSAEIGKLAPLRPGNASPPVCSFFPSDMRRCLYDILVDW